MTALAADRKTPHRNKGSISVPVAADQKIYLGALVCIDSTDGYGYPAADDANHVFAGVAMQSVDSTGYSDGDLSVEVDQELVHEFVAAGLAITDWGAALYVSDDQTVAKSTTNSVLVGKLAFYKSATEAPVKLMPGNGPIS